MSKSYFDVTSNPIYSEFINLSRYARYRDDLGRREVWPETVARYFDFFDGHIEKHHPKSVEEYRKIRKELESSVFNLKTMPSMRALMTAGKALELDNMAGFNPVTGDTRVVTRELGNINISELEGKEYTVLNKNGEWTSATFKSYGSQHVRKITLRLDSTTKTVQATYNHRWVLEDGRVKASYELVEGDRIAFVSAPKPEPDADYILGVRHGLVYGDGTALTSCERVTGYRIRLYGNNKELLQFFDGYPVIYPDSANGDPIVMMHDGFAQTHALKEVPDASETESYLLGFMRGLIAASDSVVKMGRVSLYVSAEAALWIKNHGERLGFTVQRIGTRSSNTSSGKKHSYVVHLSRSSVVAEDFLCSWQKSKFESWDSPHYVVTSATDGGLGRVYCAEVPDTNTFVLEGGLVTGNCSYLPIDDPRCFDELMYILLCGTGVGFSVEERYVNRLPVVSEEFHHTETPIVVSDSKIGWASALREMISLLYAGRIPSWDMSRVRPAGARLKTFGGRSSGPEPLKALFHFTVELFCKAAGRRLTTLESHDLVCKIADVVVVGGVRRSALISLTDVNDDRMRVAKSGQWWIENPQRALANISATYNEKPSFELMLKELVALYESRSGERGIFSRYASQKQAEKNGRRESDHEYGTNPCLTADMLLLTDRGLQSIGALASRHEPFMIYNGNREYRPSVAWRTGVKPVYEVTLSNGLSFKATADHRVEVCRKQHPSQDCDTETMESRVDALAVGTRMKTFVGNGQWHGEVPCDFTEAIMAGLFHGAGYVSDVDPDSICVVIEDDVEEVEAALHYVYGSHVRKTTYADGAVVYTIMGIRARLESLGLSFDPFSQRQFPRAVLTWSSDMVRGFVRGVYSATGSSIPEQNRITLRTTCKPFIDDMQRLMVALGFSAFTTTSGEGCVLDVVGYDDYERFRHEIGFLQLHECAMPANGSGPSKAPRSAEVVSVAYVGEEEVFDFHESDTHWGWVNGLKIHNCSEIILRPMETCNLSEVVIRPNDTLKQLKDKVRTATILGTLQSTLTRFRYVRKAWQRNGEEERLLGVSLTGIMDHPVLNGSRTWDGTESTGPDNDILKQALKELKQVAIDTNKQWAQQLGINQSVAITCVKPSGTVSQLCDTSSGIHPRYSKYYLRSVRCDTRDPIAQFMIDRGFIYELARSNPNTYVFYFPVKSPDHTVTSEQVGAIQQLELWRTYQEHWCEHKPSMTCYYRDHEFLDVASWVWKGFDRISGVSFLPHTDHTYEQAPYIEISKETYEEYLDKQPDPATIDWTELGQYEFEDNTTGQQELACSAGSCEI